MTPFFPALNSRALIVSMLLGVVSASWSQDSSPAPGEPDTSPAAVPEGAAEPTEPPEPEERAGFDASFETRKGARILNLSIPGPRGQIVDRNGLPMAQNQVAWYLGMNFPLMDDAPDENIVSYASTQLKKAGELTGGTFELDRQRVLEHYRDRRWLPMIFSSVLSQNQVEAVRKASVQGLVLHPTYQRVYPLGTTAAHIIGYVGKRGPWPKGEIPNGEDMWPTASGVQGLEASFDEYLTGSPGEIQIIFNEKGERMEETITRAPVPGHNLVTSLDMSMQKLAETELEKGAKRGAFVVMDVQTGDILAMASFPSYDPNDFIPRISTEKFEQLRTDPDNPLYARSFQGAYPPASTFKIPAALGMLEAHKIDAKSTFSCPNAYRIGDRVFHNWNKDGEGNMNVIGAITRSCNTFFYQAAIQTGSTHITNMGKRFGLGQKTGIQLREEVAGFMPTNEWHLQEYGYPILDGDLANIVIGQGQVLTTPLQVAQMMASVGNRKHLVDARLVLQVQDFANGIVKAYDISNQRNLNISQYSLSVVHEGMKDVVNSGRGTAARARHDRISISGKTGTGQWKPNQKQNIAWFAGFAPSEFPVYSFAAIYEGEPGENVGGGKDAAPIVGAFFKDYLTDTRLARLQEKSDEIKVAMGEIVEEIPEIESGSIFQNKATAKQYEEATPPPQAQPAEPPRKKGLFQRLFGN